MALDEELKRAEIRKLDAETASLKGVWTRPASWVPLLIAVGAIGQCQLSSIADREKAINAREQVLEKTTELTRKENELKMVLAKLTVAQSKHEEILSAMAELGVSGAEVLINEAKTLSKSAAKELFEVTSQFGVASSES